MSRNHREAPFASISEALAAFRQGRMVIIVDDEDRENEGDLCLPAVAVTPEAIAFMARHGRGLICVPVRGEQLDRLGVPLARRELDAGRALDQPNFALPVDAARGIGSGISAADRATTIRVLTDPTSAPDDLCCPGHVFPLRYTEGGVLRRRGQTEASIDLAVLAGLPPAAVICEVINDDGTVAQLDDLAALSRRFSLPIVTVQQIVDYRLSGIWPLDAEAPIALVS
ncbi:MAG: 3,4-dihydroxy-2-butanone-4-phosphate synthase [Chloroflexota bacterium]|nr:3,4-dihydroxy-2-butanone-4-phosphate synthase [Dehalococcoidia bacterium]MDW8253504.1 3,4-dihydroxy-2-butanone-4-phosphate synthase [Chloroflexota bacterium]